MSEQQRGAQTLERQPEDDGHEVRATDRPVLEWLRAEFPEWEMRVERTTTADGQERPLWKGRGEGRHPQ